MYSKMSAILKCIVCWVFLCVDNLPAVCECIGLVLILVHAALSSDLDSCCIIDSDFFL